MKREREGEREGGREGRGGDKEVRERDDRREQRRVDNTN